jgi:hypothetical protein
MRLSTPSLSFNAAIALVVSLLIVLQPSCAVGEEVVPHSCSASPEDVVNINQEESFCEANLDFLNYWKDDHGKDVLPPLLSKHHAATSTPSSCTLFRAPSTLPDAGYGVFTTVDIHEGELVGSEELILPIHDVYKNYPYRGQERFKSWLRYVWPAYEYPFHVSNYHAFPKIPRRINVDEGLSAAIDGLQFVAYVDDDDEDQSTGDDDDDDDDDESTSDVDDDDDEDESTRNDDDDDDDDESPSHHHDDDDDDDDDGRRRQRINAVVPGIASLANSHDNLEDYVNLAPIYYDRNGDENENDTGEDVMISFRAMRDIPAGSELFIYYGTNWHELYDERMAQKPNYDTIEDYNREWNFTLLPTQQDRYNQMHTVDGIRRKKWPSEEGGDTSTDTTIRGAFRKEQITPNLGEEEADKNDPTTTARAFTNHTTNHHPYRRSVEWILQEGDCIDQIAESTSEQEGVFAKHFLSHGDIITTAPLLAIKRDDLTIYPLRDEEEEEEDGLLLDFTTVVGTEPILSYCYSHPDSNLLLFPLSPSVNYIRHYMELQLDHHDDDNDASPPQPNAMIQWPQQSSSSAPSWLEWHPIYVAEHSGELQMQFVALRDIAPGEEIVIDKGPAWNEYIMTKLQQKRRQTEGGDYTEEENDSDDEEEEETLWQPDLFTHEIQVPDGFFPEAWLHNTSMDYEVDVPTLQPGEFQPLTWKHNGKPIAPHMYRLGLPTGFSQHNQAYVERMGIMDMYQTLLTESPLESDDWMIFDGPQDEENGGREGEWFALRYMSAAWQFNMHYVAAWDDVARRSFLREMGAAGFDTVLDTLGKAYGLDNMTCFHSSFMGVSHAGQSFTHTDVYATGEKGFNIIWPIKVVNGTRPELNVQTEDANVVVAVHYAYDTAIIMGDWGYHSTNRANYNADDGVFRLVVGAYCAQVDDKNKKMLAYIYDGEEPAPFMDQFENPEIHWSRTSDEYKLAKL